MGNTIEHSHLDAYFNLTYSMTKIVCELIQKTGKEKYYDLITLADGFFHGTFERVEEFNQIERHAALYTAFFEKSLWTAALEAKVDINDFAHAFISHNQNLNGIDPLQYANNDFKYFVLGSSIDLCANQADIIKECLCHLTN